MYLPPSKKRAHCIWIKQSIAKVHKSEWVGTRLLPKLAEVMAKDVSYLQKEAVVYSLESIMTSGVGQQIYADKISPILATALKSKVPNLRFVTLKVLAKLVKSHGGQAQIITPELKGYLLNSPF